MSALWRCADFNATAAAEFWVEEMFGLASHMLGTDLYSRKLMDLSSASAFVTVPDVTRAGKLYAHQPNAL